MRRANAGGVTLTQQPRQIFGISDSASFFVGEEVRPVLAEKMVEISHKERPVVCYIGAAKGDKPERIAEFKRLAERIHAIPKILSLYDPPSDCADNYFASTDIVFIDGGSTRNLLALFREWGVVNPLRRAYHGGMVIAGASAGLNILYNWSITDSIKSSLRPIEGLGILDGSVCVHHNAHPDRPRIFEQFLHKSSIHFPAFTLDDGVAVHFRNEEIVDILTLSEQSHFNQLTKHGERIQHRPVNATRMATS